MCRVNDHQGISRVPGRNLAWQNCYNLRDLGGLRTMSGAETRWKSVLRADMLGRLTESGRQALLDYGVRTIIDLRAPQEAAEEPSVSFMGLEGKPAYLNLPVEYYYPHVSKLIIQAKNRAEVYCIILDHYPDAIAEVMRAIISAQEGGIVFHCHSGTDRTGIISALLLSLAGVPADIIADDYAESQVRLQPLYERMNADHEDDNDGDFWRKPTATADMMCLMLAHLDEKYGGVAGYLRGSRLSSSEIDQLKKRICDS